jgi:integrase/recombinase XerD
MAYQYVREPLTADESDRLPSACVTATQRLVVWTLLDTGLRVGELCGLTPRNVLWHQRQLRVKGKAGTHGMRAKVRVVPMSPRARALLEHHFALEKAFPVKVRRAQDIVKAVADRAGIVRDVSPHILRHTFTTTAIYLNFTATSRKSSSGSGENRPVGCPVNWTAYGPFLRRCYSTPGTHASSRPGSQRIMPVLRSIVGSPPGK